MTEKSKTPRNPQPDLQSPKSSDSDQGSETENQPASSTGIQKSAFPVVGIGASAGGVKTLQDFFRHLPAETGMAFIVVMHLSKDHKSNLAELLDKLTVMPVETAEEGNILAPNRVFIIPANHNLSLKGHRLKLSERQIEPGGFMPIDYFLKSLAEQHEDRAIGVILSGTGTDGTNGVRAIKAASGITFAQSEESAQFNEMPHNAIQSGQVDLVLTAAEIATTLSDLVHHPHLRQTGPAIEEQASTAWQRIQKRLQSTGIDFSQYKQNSIRRRVSRRMAIHQIESLEEYAGRLKDNDQELKDLREDLLIKVTQFFRNPETFTALVEQVVPQIVESKKDNETIRIWVPGCASGEEVYSLAITLCEYFEGKDAYPNIQIFGTDVSEIAISKARKGYYPQAALNDLSLARQNKFFISTDGGYLVKKYLREICVFACQDFISDPPFSNIDLISCRNVLIYFSSALQSKVFRLFHYALNRNGFLVLGSSENIGKAEKLFENVDKKQRIYRKKVNAQQLTSFGWLSQKNRSFPASQEIVSSAQLGRKEEKSLSREIDRFILRKLEPPAVLVDSELNAIQFYGNTEPFIKHSPGKASLNLLNITKDPLRLELRTMMQRVLNHQIAEQKEFLYLEGNQEACLSLEVSPLPFEGNLYFLIQLTPSSPQRNNLSHKQGMTDNTLRQENLRLKQALASSQDFSQLTIEEKDEALEDLKAANEEILSGNEELQSINEELETAKEELESGNEELTTVNQELQSRNEDLAESNDDLYNLILSVHIPFVIINKDLTIRSVSKYAEESLLIAHSDVGRSITELNLSFEFPDLEATLRDVIDSGKELEREIRDRTGRWNLLRIRPYLSKSSSDILGVVLALFNIDRLKSSMEETENAYKYALQIVETIKDPLLVLDDSLRINKANAAFYQMFKVSPKETVNVPLYQLGTGQWDHPELRRLLGEILPQSTQMDDFPITFDFPVLGLRNMLLSARKMKISSSGRDAILLNIQDISEHRQIEDHLRQAREDAEEANRAKGEFLATMSHEIRTPLTVILGALEYLIQEDQATQTENPDRTQGLKLAEKASKSLFSLIGDILDFSKIDAQQLTLESEPFCLKACVEEVTLSMRIKAEDKGLKLEQEIAPDIPSTLVGDQNRVKQVLTNLIGNAIKFSKSGTIKIKVKLQEAETRSARGEDQKILLSVSDQGPGIPSNKMKLLFESFSQVNSSINRKYGGSGLGLAICKGIVKKMTGDIWAESTEGEGSTFFFTLPCQKERRKSTRSQQDSHSDEAATEPSQDKRILLVEDDPAVQKTLQLLLDQSKWELELATNGQKAIEFWQQGDFDLILMDLQMPVMDGLTAARQIRSLETADQHIPIIALSAHALPQTRTDCLAAGMDDLLIKPLRGEDLREAIKRHC